MSDPNNPKIHVGKAASVLIDELGIDPLTILKRADLPSGLLQGDGSRISLDAYYRLLTAVTDEADDPHLALKLGDASGIDYFDPAFFAAMCSPNMNVAAQRMADYKRRVSPFRLDVRTGDRDTTIVFRAAGGHALHPTQSLTEIVFLVNFMRRATRQRIVPNSVAFPFNPPDLAAYEAHFGCVILRKSAATVTVHAQDAALPFVTHNDEIWALFEPQLRRDSPISRKSPLTTRARVAHCLNEFLPSGRASVEDVARELAMSKRTLQRRLAEDGTTWLEALNDAREALAKHYLTTTDFGATQISFLLGFEDPNSFYRAFRRWEGASPEHWRNQTRMQPHKSGIGTDGGHIGTSRE
ncbi:AraC family transcriptional regulator [Pseudooctadecabacter jejudonensis]|uniref:AraC family transcriptional regulator n=1 Tax=Pseudooctadecabacter jejudonensis TaxID=1391910 RepID=UPI0013562DB3|nr:AraC family transcriptional regulator [Pseudooctadecabacter jejudonensis]